jgi:hypothetical protein
MEAIQQAKHSRWMEPFRYLYIALEEFNFFWEQEQVFEFDLLWREGWSIWYIADYFQRDPDEVLILYMDRIRKKMIHDRPNGLFGTKGRRP